MFPFAQSHPSLEEDLKSGRRYFEVYLVNFGARKDATDFESAVKDAARYSFQSVIFYWSGKETGNIPVATYCPIQGFSFHPDVKSYVP